MKQIARLFLVVVLIMGLGAFLGGVFAYLYNEGWLECWQPLGYPPEKATKISVHQEYLPFVETNNGQIYFCSQALLNQSSNCWIESSNSVPESIETHLCHTINHLNTPRPPGRVMDSVEVFSCKAGLSPFTVTTQYNFMLLEDGSVWMWQHNFAVFDSLLVYWYVIAGCFWGLIVGIIAIAILVTIRYFNSRRVKVVTDQAKPIGRIVSIKPTEEAQMEELSQSGLVAWSGRKLAPIDPVVQVRGERTVADLLLEDRE